MQRTLLTLACCLTLAAASTAQVAFPFVLLQDPAQKQPADQPEGVQTDLDNTEIEMAKDKEPEKKVEREEIPDAPKGELPKYEESKPFYAKTVEFQGKASIPHEVTVKAELFDFRRKEYKAGNCRYTVAVPTHRVVSTYTTCQLREVDGLKMQAAIRTDGGTVDVFVLDAPGMPAKYALLLSEPVAEVEKRFNVKLAE